MSKYHEKLESIIIEGFQDFFRNRFSDSLKFSPNIEFEFDDCYCARIAVKSETINGYLAICASKSALYDSHPERRYGDEILEEDLADWIGEIVNRVLGNIKNELLKIGINTTLNPPEFSKEIFEDIKEGGENLENYVFSNKNESICVLFKADISNQLDFDAIA